MLETLVFFLKNGYIFLTSWRNQEGCSVIQLMTSLSKWEHILHFLSTAHTEPYTLVSDMNEHTLKQSAYPSLPCLPDIPSKRLRKRKWMCWSEACSFGSWNRMEGRSPAVIHSCVACIGTSHTYSTHKLTSNQVDKALKQMLIINLSHVFGYWSVAVCCTFPRLIFSLSLFYFFNFFFFFCWGPSPTYNT